MYFLAVFLEEKKACYTNVFLTCTYFRTDTVQNFIFSQANLFRRRKHATCDSEKLLQDDDNYINKFSLSCQ